MDTRHLVDPELLPALDAFPPLAVDARTLPLIRQAGGRLPAAPVPAGVATREVLVPREGHPDVRVLVTRPSAQATAPRPALLWIHGGGYVIGSADADRPQAAAYALRLDAVVVSVDYGLAPENPHPGPVEDCYAALRWLHGCAGDLGADPARIAVGGASAGGGLAAALALLARDRGEVPIAFQLLVYPMIDDRTAVSPGNPLTGEFVWTRESNRFGWTSLLGAEPGGPDVSPYAAAARAEDLAGLPPAFVDVGTLDLFLEEDVEYALRLSRAGVPVELHVYPGAFHGYQMAADAAVTRTAHDLAVTALRRALTVRP